MKIKMQMLLVLLMATTISFGQDIPEAQVPSIIVNKFKAKFPKASDVEWEMEGNLYNVDFEIGWSTDYEAWYTASGNLVKHTQEISQKDLPQAVKNAVKKQYPGYRIDDAKKISTNGIETYKVELEKKHEDLDVIFSKEGQVIQKQL